MRKDIQTGSILTRKQSSLISSLRHFPGEAFLRQPQLQPRAAFDTRCTSHAALSLRMFRNRRPIKGKRYSTGMIRSLAGISNAREQRSKAISVRIDEPHGSLCLSIHGEAMSVVKSRLLMAGGTCRTFDPRDAQGIITD